MDDNMQPLQAFVDHYVRCNWKIDKEYIIHNSELHRFRIISESAVQESLKGGFIGLWRSETLADRGIDATCPDAKEFAEALLNGPFERLSPHEIMHVIKALQDYIDAWHQERKAVFMANPEVYGGFIPTDDDKFCQG